MDRLSNAFSALELDAEDDKVEQPLPPSSSSSSSKSGKRKKKANSHRDNKTDSSIDKKSDISIENKANGSTDENYRMPLVWIDLEMTGLNIEVDRILEIACIITDGDLAKSVEGPDLVIHQSKECLDTMGEWCQSHHEASGLTKKVLQSTTSEREAEKQVIDFVKRHVGTHTPLLAGNSIYVDFMFLKKYMPDLASLFSHVVVDVSSLKALCMRWYPRDNRNAPPKKKTHRALDDIRESIIELRYYRQNIFKPKSKK